MRVAGRATLRRAWARHEAPVLGAVGLAGFVVGWELLARSGVVDPVVLGAPGRVAAALARQWASGRLLADLGWSAAEFALGLGLAAAGGVLLGLAMGLARDLEDALAPPLWFFYAAPLVAFQPLIVVWLGFGFRAVVALVFLLTVVPIAMNTLAAVRSVDPLFPRAVRAFGGGWRDVVAKAILPAALPLVLAGVRLGAGRALVGVVVGEMFGANAGLGFRMTFDGARLRTADVLASVVLLVALGVAVTQAIRLLEHRLGRWREA